MTDNLRHNLQRVMRPYGIRLVYSDSDMPNGQIFDSILRSIRSANFCIFDDRETETRPNVYIELGAAIALDKPYFYFSAQKKRSVVLKRKHEPIGTPSDLAGMLNMPYERYETLFLEFALRLPAFLLDRRFAKR
ncbi:MAG: hypothetical protein ABSH32_17735 [Bryobacteraceae bacterium]